MNRTAISGALALSVLLVMPAYAQENPHQRGRAAAAVASIASAVHLPDIPLADAGGLYMADPVDSTPDNTTGRAASIGLRYAGNPLGVQGLQFTIRTTGRFLRMKRVELGPDIPSPGKWTIDYQIANAASGSELRVIAFGADTTVKIGVGDHHDLFRVIYDVADIASGIGGNRVVASMTLEDVSSVLAHRLGTSAGVGVAPNGGTLQLSIYDAAARGDLNGDQRTDILGLLDLADAIRGARVLEPWQFNRADLAPWNAAWSRAGSIFDDAVNYGDGRIDGNDLGLMTDVILRGSWPDGDRLATAPERSTQATPTPQATIWCATSVNGARVGIESDLPVKGLQLRLAADRFPAVITLLRGRDLPDDFVMEKMVMDGELRLLIYSPHGRSIPAGTSDLVEISGGSGNWSFAAPVVLAGMENNSLSVRSEIRGAVAGINPDAATQPTPVCWPNPLATSALIRYRLEKASVVTVMISDLKGREIARPLIGIRQDAGEHMLDFDATGIPTGNYLCAIVHDGIRALLKLVVAR